MSDSQPPPQQPNPSPSSPPGSAEPAALLLCGARLTDGRTVDVRLGGGRIEAVGTAGSLAGDPVVPGPAHPATASFPVPASAATDAGAATAPARVNLEGYLLLPAPVEPHAHADTALTAESDGPAPGDPQDVQRRATEAVLAQLGHGATAIRSHVRVGDVQGLGALEAVLRVRGTVRDLVDLMVVAMPRLLTGAAGADGPALLRDAVGMGATVVGGCPDRDPDPTGYVEAVLDLASAHGCAVDLHTDGTDPARLCRLASMAGGLRGGVTVGPLGGLGLLPTDVASRCADRLAAAGVGVVCLPQGGCAGADRRGTAPVRLLRAAGVRVAAGSGSLRDLSNPVGRGDPLEAAYLLASQDALPVEDAYGTVSAAGRAVLGLPPVRIEAGFPADLIAVRGDRLAGALSLAYSRIVIHAGRVVSRTSAVREYCDLGGAGAGPELPRQARHP
ncbi:amidohydrolase family protein [Streptomyces fragilis]|uniref:Amidohydrolase family protein n=1 Tax=Streptomyces fragilis TaxID=67301 RepID=A0ABV2YP49_9ACTN|nr:amidohydrolase family protein [Streptomyces fragilis]